MKTYSTDLVERLLRNLLDIREMLSGGSGAKVPDNYAIRTPKKRTDDQRELPLGMSPNDPRGWPFREPQHAKEPFDGKAKAKLTQELHCSVIDLEMALERKDQRGNYLVDEDDMDLLLKYHILQTHTLDDLLHERQAVSRGSMQRRILRAVRRLAGIMEQGQ